jgi:thymidylate synthase (FAD)
MHKIEVSVIDNHNDPAGMMMFLARLTQRGHNIKSMDDLTGELDKSHGIAADKPRLVEAIAKLPHGTIKRFTPITVAIVGASRRFLAQARTHQVGLTYVSASLQYSDYSGEADFVVPYPIIEADERWYKTLDTMTKPSNLYLRSCQASMSYYEKIASLTDNDTAGYAAPQGLRNILIIQGNHESWMNFINRRGCNRNTLETQYVTLRIWEELLKTPGGEEMFKYAGPDCVHGRCREGKMCCGSPIKVKTPTDLIKERFPLLRQEG